MAYDLSIEDPDAVFLITTRTLNSRLWFVNARKLQKRILSHLAKYAEKYGVILYAFVIMGNHYHLIARFPRGNKAEFLQSFNAIIARLTATLVPTYEGGKLWARRAKVQLLPRAEDITHWFLYSALNPVSSGLVDCPRKYRSYNSFSDAVRGISRSFSIVNWADFRNRSRYNKKLTVQDCTTTHTLTFARLPGYEHLSEQEYTQHLLKLHEDRRQELIQEFKAQGKTFPAEAAVKRTVTGSRPHSTKTSDRWSYRPLCLTLCPDTRRDVKARIFAIIEHFREASLKFRQGCLDAVFPLGTYRPRLKVYTAT
jgi:REP element-mobilizing transposase RayT